MSSDHYIITYVEIDIRTCSLTYGSSPCTASIPGTGTKKCFNSVRTCQDRANFDEVSVTLRFGIDNGYLPDDIECIPSLLSVNYDGSTISLGQNLGIRSTITATLRDGPHPDVGPGFDRYIADRDYADPYRQGTLWGKLRARHVSLRGIPFRLIRGRVGQTLEEMETYHGFCDSTDGPSSESVFTIRAKDVFKFLDDDRSVAPRANTGTLSANIDNSQTSAVLTPSGIGNLEYPSSGLMNIGGKEIVSFTRSGNNLTITRAQRNTSGVAHTAGERMQIVLVYSAEDPADILEDLLTTYGNIDPAMIDVGDWLAETEAYFQRVFTAYIAEPTGVNKLCSEIVEQACLAFWPDPVGQQIRLQVLRAVSPEATIIDQSLYEEDSFGKEEQPDKRVSEVFIYFAQRNPLEPLENENNYLSQFSDIDIESASDYGSNSIKKIYSRWIPFGGSSTAERLAAIQLARYTDPPRKFMFELLRTHTPLALGNGYYVSHPTVQDDEGYDAVVPAQIVWSSPTETAYQYEAEEMSFGEVPPDDPTNHVITIDASTYGVNLKNIHDSIFAPIVDGTGITVTCIIQSHVIIGAGSTSAIPFNVGAFHSATTIIVKNYGKIRGCGGDGGTIDSVSGKDGGTAFYTRKAITLENYGDIKSGGGGGGASGYQHTSFPDNWRVGGGGGAGKNGGAQGNTAFNSGHSQIATAGTLDDGGVGFIGPLTQVGNRLNGGYGGDPGQPGQTGFGGHGPYGVGGNAGNAVDGHSYITYSVVGTITGPQVN